MLPQEVYIVLFVRKQKFLLDRFTVWAIDQLIVTPQTVLKFKAIQLLTEFRIIGLLHRGIDCLNVVEVNILFVLLGQAVQK
jgi:hypothetical protein